MSSRMASTAAKKSRTGNNQDENAESRTRWPVAGRVRASACGARWGRGSNRRVGGPVATALRASRTSVNRRLHRGLRHGRARRVPPSANAPRVRYPHKAWAELLRLKAQSGRCAWIQSPFSVSQKPRHAVHEPTRDKSEVAIKFFRNAKKLDRFWNFSSGRASQSSQSLHFGGPG